MCLVYDKRSSVPCGQPAEYAIYHFPVCAIHAHLAERDLRNGSFRWNGRPPERGATVITSISERHDVLGGE